MYFLSVAAWRATWREVFAHPVQEVVLAGVKGAARLAAEVGLAGIRRLYWSNRTDPYGVFAILSSPHLGRLERLTLDLSGLTAAGLAPSVIRFGSLAGAVPLFDQIAVINNPNNYGVQITYNANSIDVTIVPGTPAPPVTYSTDVWTGLGGNSNWSCSVTWMYRRCTSSAKPS